MGVSFQFHTQKTPKPVTAPKVDKVQRTGTRNARRCGDIARGAASQYAESWCRSITSGQMVVKLKRDPHASLSLVIESAQNHGR